MTVVFRIFDPGSWLCILLSLASLSLACLLLAAVSSWLGVTTLDPATAALTPLQMLLGEQLGTGDWFVKKRQCRKEEIFKGNC